MTYKKAFFILEPVKWRCTCSAFDGDDWGNIAPATRSVVCSCGQTYEIPPCAYDSVDAK